MIKKLTLLSLVSVVGLTSCFKDEYDFDNLKTDNYNPTIGAPLLNAKVSLEDVLQDIDTTLIQADENNLLKITISDTVTSFVVSELIEVPEQNMNQNYNLEPFSINDISFNADVSLGDMAANLSNGGDITSANGSTTYFPPIGPESAGAYSLATSTDFTQVTLSQGTLSATITNHWPVTLDSIVIEVQNVSDGSVIGTLRYGNIPAKQPNDGTPGVQTREINLAEKLLSNNIQGAVVKLESAGSGPDPLDDDSYKTINVDDLIQVRSVCTNLEVVSGLAVLPDQQAIEEDIDLEFEFDNGEQLETVVLSSGSIDYEINYGVMEDAEITINLPYITDPQGNPVNRVIPIDSDNINPTLVSGSIDLTNHEVDLTAGGSGTNVVQASVRIENVSSGGQIPFDTSNVIETEFSFGNLSVSYVDGYVGNFVEEIDSNTYNFSMFDNEFSEMISLADPRLSMRFNNSAGIPVDASFTSLFTTSEGGGNLDLTGFPNPLRIAAPASNDGSGVITEIELNQNNSNLADVFNSNPSGLVYEIQVETNPEGVANNFITSDSRIDVTLDVEIPMYGSVNGFVMEDTLDFSGETFEMFKQATLKAIIENELPVDLDVQLYFTDDNYTVLDSLFGEGQKLVVSSTVDANGDLESASISDNDIVFSESKILAIQDAKHAILKASLQTANGGTTDAKFYTHYEMDIKLGIIASIKLPTQE